MTTEDVVERMEVLFNECPAFEDETCKGIASNWLSLLACVIDGEYITPDYLTWLIQDKLKEEKRYMVSMSEMKDVAWIYLMYDLFIHLSKQPNNEIVTAKPFQQYIPSDKTRHDQCACNKK